MADSGNALPCPSFNSVDCLKTLRVILTPLTSWPPPLHSTNSSTPTSGLAKMNDKSNDILPRSAVTLGQSSRKKSTIANLSFGAISDSINALTKPIVDPAGPETLNASQTQVDDISTDLGLCIEQSVSHVTFLAPGVLCVDHVIPIDLSSTLGAIELSSQDQSLISKILTADTAVQVFHILPYLIQLAQNKHCVVDYLLYSVCCSDNESRCDKMLTSVEHTLSGCYDCVTGVDTWRLNYKQLHFLLEEIVGYSIENPITTEFSRPDATTSSLTNPDAFLIRVQCFSTCIHRLLKYERCELEAGEISHLISALLHLSLDVTCIQSVVISDIKLAVAELLSKLSEHNFLLIEPQLCSSVTNIASFHHNLLHLVQTIPRYTTRACEFRQTLAVVSLYKIVGGPEHTASCDWRLEEVVDLWDSIEVGDDSDMYELHSIISLTDECLGFNAQPEEVDELTCLRNIMNRSVARLSDNMLNPDLKKVKHLVKSLNARWTWLINSVSKLPEVLGLQAQATPTKVRLVQSQEANEPGDVDEENGSDTEPMEDDTPDKPERLSISPDPPDPQDADVLHQIQNFVDRLKSPIKSMSQNSSPIKPPRSYSQPSLISPNKPQNHILTSFNSPSRPRNDNPVGLELPKLPSYNYNQASTSSPIKAPSYMYSQPSTSGIKPVQPAMRPNESGVVMSDGRLLELCESETQPVVDEWPDDGLGGDNSNNSEVDESDNSDGESIDDLPDLD